MMQETKSADSDLPKSVKARFIKALKISRVKDCIFYPLVIILGLAFSFKTGIWLSYFMIIELFAFFYFPLALISYRQAIEQLEQNEYTWWTDNIHFLSGGMHAWVSAHYMRYMSTHFIPYDTWTRGEVYVVRFEIRPITFLRHMCIRI